MVTCWARTLGNCCGEQSAEHLLTAALFDGNTITIQGFPWCLSEPKVIGLSRATSNILCRDHNSQLSPVDAGAIEAFKVIRDSNRLDDVRKALPQRRWTIKRFRLKGVLLERWFLKTTINLFYVNGHPKTWHLDSREAKDPPDQFVRAVYGLFRLPAPMGLYLAAAVGDKVCHKDEAVRFTALHDQADGLLASLFEFHGFRFVLWLGTMAPPRRLPDHEALGEGWSGTDLMYHARAIRRALGNRFMSQRLVFAW